MRVVLDTNVLVSAFLSAKGNPASILRQVLLGDLELCTSAAILAEYEQVLSRPKFSDRIQAQAIKRFFEILDSISTTINSPIYDVRLPDPNDQDFYDVAKTADAVLITGNKKHFPDESFIQSPAEFLERYLGSR